MRRLLLLRHAKAEPWQGCEDFDRDLTESGRLDASALGDFLVANDLIPDHIVFSGALRTRETARLVGARLPRPVDAREDNAIYEATRPLLVALARDLPDAARVVLLVGHNPGVADFAGHLTGSGAKELRLRMAAKYPTCGLTALDCDVAQWSDLQPRCARLSRFVTPADLGLR